MTAVQRSDVYRRPGRDQAKTFRMSVEDRKKLEAAAEAQGVSVQVLLEHLVFGYPMQDRRPGRVPKSQSQGELFKAG